MISKKLNMILRYKIQFMLQRSNLYYNSSNTIKCFMRHNTTFLFKNHISRFLSTNVSPNTFHSQLESAYSIINSDNCSKCLTTLTYEENLSDDKIKDLIENQWINMNNTEILTNFKYLSYYAYKNQERIHDLKIQDIFEVLKNRCIDFNDTELMDLLKCLEKWNFKYSEPNFQQFWDVIDKECLKRMPNWSYDQIFLINDQFHKLKLTRPSEFTYKSLKKITRKLKKLSRAQLLQFLFFLKVNRRIVYNFYELEYYLEKYVDELTIEELGLMAMSFSHYDKRLRSLDFLLKVINKLQNNIDTVSDFSMSMIMRFLHYKHNPEISNAYNNLLQSLVAQIPNRSIEVASWTANMKTKICLHNKDLMLKIIDRHEKDLKTVPIQYFNQLITALSHFNYDPQEYNIYSIIMNELLHSNKIEEIKRFPKVFLNIVLNLLHANFYSEEALKLVMDPQYIDSVSKGSYYNLSQDYLFLNYYIELEHPEYNGPRIKKDLLDYLLKHFGAEILQKKLKRNKFVISNMNDVGHFIKQTLNLEAVYTDILLPQFCYDIILCWDKESKTFSSPEKPISQNSKNNIKYAPNDEKIWYSIVTCTYHSIIGNTLQPCGKLVARLRLLERIGYKPIFINFNNWQALSNDSEKENYIRNILFK